MSFAEIDISALLLRFTLLLGSVASAGGVLFWATRPSLSTDLPAIRWQVIAGASIILIVEPLRYIQFQLAISAGDLGLAFDPSMRWVAFETAMGQSSGMRWAAAFVLLLSGLRYRAVGVVGAIAIVASFALEGHTASYEGQRWLVAGLLVLHLVVAHWWIGALIPLRAAITSSGKNEIADLVDWFGARAARAVVVLVLAGSLLLGMLTSWRLDLTNTYQIAFVLKLAGFATILGIAVRNKFHWTRMLRTDPSRGQAGLRKSLSVETVVAVLILFATALVTSFPPTG